MRRRFLAGARLGDVYKRQVLMCWPAIKYAKKHGVPFTNYVLDLWPENLYLSLIHI